MLFKILKKIIIFIFSTPSGLDLVDNALKVANNFQKTKKQLESDIQTLKRKLDEKEDKNWNENFERLKFNEGSFWMSKYINFKKILL